ncbi:DUF2274 domain-containing protein [Pseudochelatococcus contaminans]|uniref:DUF2274 domain-containing protein n=1 Tax=Pseudochelatococcus contaminans TaxID=1538103 RepID=A0A7W5Z5J6_9HYPH|nr:DUF2274 domain-containing protein [Pseudochelatococcus contaminans]MBB3810092.1 hypothetical protein [Pseudochelatococcus contaminans]
MTSLKLGPLPKHGTVRVTVSMPEPLKEELDLYAAEYSRVHGEAGAATLIPHMLEAFLRSDRGWRSRKVAAQARSRSTETSVRSNSAKSHGPQSDQ